MPTQESGLDPSQSLSANQLTYHQLAYSQNQRYAVFALSVLTQLTRVIFLKLLWKLANDWFYMIEFDLGTEFCKNCLYLPVFAHFGPKITVFRTLRKNGSNKFSKIALKVSKWLVLYDRIRFRYWILQKLLVFALFGLFWAQNHSFSDFAEKRL